MRVGGMNSRGASHICTQLAKQCTYPSLTPLVLSLEPRLNEVPSWLSLLSLIIHLFIRQMHEEPLVYARLASGMDRRSTARWREGQKDRQTNQQIPDNLTDSKGGVLRSTEELNRPGKFPQNS